MAWNGVHLGESREQNRDVDVYGCFYLGSSIPPALDFIPTSPQPLLLYPDHEMFLNFLVSFTVIKLLQVWLAISPTVLHYTTSLCIGDWLLLIVYL